MNFDIIYKDEKMLLCDDFIDVGYMAEDVEAETIDKEILHVKRSEKESEFSIFLSFPDMSKPFVKELLKIDAYLASTAVNIQTVVFFDRYYDDLNAISDVLQCFQIAIDHEHEFGNMYGTQIVSGTMKDKLTKALFLISKDGALFYMDMPKDLNQSIDYDRLHEQMNKACVIYTGVGCHG